MVFFFREYKLIANAKREVVFEAASTLTEVQMLSFSRPVTLNFVEGGGRCRSIFEQPHVSQFTHHFPWKYKLQRLYISIGFEQRASSRLRFHLSWHDIKYIYSRRLSLRKCAWSWWGEATAWPNSTLISPLWKHLRLLSRSVLFLCYIAFHIGEKECKIKISLPNNSFHIYLQTISSSTVRQVCRFRIPCELARDYVKEVDAKTSRKRKVRFEIKNCSRTSQFSRKAPLTLGLDKRYSNVAGLAPIPLALP